MTDVIRETAAGVYLDSRESFYQDARENKTVGKPLPTIVWIKRLPGFSKEGSLAALEVCVDATKTVVTRNGKQLPEGEMFLDGSTSIGSTADSRSRTPISARGRNADM